MRFVTFLVLALSLAACGGSSSSSEPGPGELELFAGMPGRDAAISGGLLDGPGTVARFSLGLRLAADPAGNLYVADTGNHAIRKITPQGIVSTLLVRNVPGEDLLDVAVDPAGVVHFSVAACTFSSDHRTVLGCRGAIYRLSPTLEAQLVTPRASSDGSPTDLGYPSSLAFDASGNLYVSDEGLATFVCAVRRMTPAGDLTTVAPTCGGLAVAPDGTVYLGTGSAVVRIVNGAASLFAGSSNPAPSHVDGPGVDARFAGTGGMAFDVHGNLYVVDSGSMTVRKITPQAVVTTVVGTPLPIDLGMVARFVPGPLPGELDHPGEVAIVGSDLYITMPFSIAVVHDAP